MKGFFSLFFLSKVNPFIFTMSKKDKLWLLFPKLIIAIAVSN